MATKKDEKIAREARIACEKWRQYFKRNSDQYHRMMEFVLGRQWTEDEEDTMIETFKKVPLQFNKLATLVNSVLGEQQQNTPQLEVFPLSMCDEKTAEIRATVVKDGILSDNAKTVYQVAAFQAIVGGYGSFLVDTDYSHSRSFEQDIVYRHFKDSTRNYWDVSAEHVNKIDGMHCGSLTRMSRELFRETFGDDVEEDVMRYWTTTATKQEIALAVDPGLKDDSFSWADDEGITINDYYKRKFKKVMLYKLSNGVTLLEEEMDKLRERSIEQAQRIREQQEMMGEYAEFDEIIGQPIAADDEAMKAGEEDGEEIDVEERVTLYYEGEPVRIEDKREIKQSYIVHYRIAGDWILDESEFPADDCPIVFMDQNSYYDKNGKQVCRPFIIDAVDAQRYINYLGTQSAFVLKISRYDQFIGSKKNVQSLDTQQAWKDPYSVKGILTYDESPSGAKPEQIRPPELSASLTQQYQRAIEDLYTSTGLYPARLGMQGNEVSGAAVDARTRQGSYSTYVVFNSINRAITAGGKVFNQMVPRVYDSERVLNLMTPDKGRQNITINRQIDDYGEKIENDLRKGTFEVRLIAGPSYEGQKAEALESLNMILQANPQLLSLIADLYAENLPLSNTLEIKNRLKTIVPPQIIEAGKTGDMPEQQAQGPSPEEQKLQMEQQEMQMEAQYKQQQIEIKKQELAIKIQQMQADIEIEHMKLEIAQLEMAGNVEEQRMRYLAETDRTQSDNAIAHADNLVKILTHSPKHEERNRN